MGKVFKLTASIVYVFNHILFCKIWQGTAVGRGSKNKLDKVLKIISLFYVLLLTFSIGGVNGTVKLSYLYVSNL